MSTKIVLINDPGIDGAFAVSVALFDSEIEVVGLLATPGNVPGDQATKNLRIILDQLDPPRWPRLGCGPDVDYGIDGAKLHGLQGLGNTDFPCASLHHLISSEKMLVDLVRQYPHELTIVCAGPLTVVARALDLFPELPGLVQQIIVVGSSLHEPGNAGPVSEFHFYCDPKAAHKVMHCDAPITLIPLDMMRKALYSPTELLSESTAMSPAFHFLRQIVPYGIAAMSSLYGIEGFYLEDVLGVAAVGFPAAIHTRKMCVDVEIHGELTRGMSVFDRRAWQQVSHNANVVVEVDTKALRQYVNRVIGY